MILKWYNGEWRYYDAPVHWGNVLPGTRAGQVVSKKVLNAYKRSLFTALGEQR